MNNDSMKSSMFYFSNPPKISQPLYFQGTPAIPQNPKRITKVKHREAPKIRGFPM